MDKNAHKKVTLAYFKDAALHKDGFYDAHDASELKHSFWQRRVRAHIVTRVRALSGTSTSLLDVGCGNGDFIAELASKHPHLTHRGHDFSSEMIAIAREKHTSADNLIYETQDLLHPGNAAFDRYDIVICINMFHHLHADDLNRGLDSLSQATSKHLLFEIKNENNLWNRKMRPAGDFPVTLISPSHLKRHFATQGLRFKAQWNIFGLDFLSPIVVLEFDRMAEVR